MSIFRQLMEKPWLEDDGDVVELHSGRAFALARSTLGLRVFLAVVMVIFSLLVAAYTERMVFSDWHAPPIPWLLWPNTVVLILSSAALEWALVGTRRGEIDRVRMGLFASGILAFLFLAGQLLAWRELVASGYYASSDPANAFFYLLTAMHGVHLVGGLVAWNKTRAKIRRGLGVEQVRQSIELCAVYWHFLLLIWLFLFALLLLT